MPTFNPNIAKTAKANVTVKPAGLSYKCELYLVKDTTKYNTSGLISLTSTGAAQPASFPITMPSAGGTYKVWLDVFSDNVLIGAFEAIEKITIEAFGRLSGTVTDAITGAIIVGARVELIGALYDLTDATGKYDITGITPGTYSGKVSAAGYQEVIMTIVLVGGQTKQLDVSLTPVVTIALYGKVTEQTTGIPIANANVDAYVSMQGHMGAFTDSAGNYRISGLLLEGIAYVTVTAEGYETWTQNINIIAPETRADFALTPISVPPEANFSIEITGASKMNPNLGEYSHIYYRVTNTGIVAAEYGHLDYADGNVFANTPDRGVLLQPGQSHEDEIVVRTTVPRSITFSIAVTTCPRYASGYTGYCAHGWVITGRSNTITITWG